MSGSTPVTPEPVVLVRLFHDALASLGRFTPCRADQLPSPYRELLAHEHHMTVTVERFHGGPVDVEVLNRSSDATHYSREILLRRQRDGAVVQYGIMRVGWQFLSREVRQAIERADTPLGRILIEHNVLREIHLVSLWRIETGPVLNRHFALSGSLPTCGRVAVIDCNGEPAIELLEIVTPA